VSCALEWPCGPRCNGGLGGTGRRGQQGALKVEKYFRGIMHSFPVFGKYSNVSNGPCFPRLEQSHPEDLPQFEISPFAVVSGPYRHSVDA
jgi:hypothetical protein